MSAVTKVPFRFERRSVAVHGPVRAPVGTATAGRGSHLLAGSRQFAHDGGGLRPGRPRLRATPRNRARRPVGGSFHRAVRSDRGPHRTRDSRTASTVPDSSLSVASSGRGRGQLREDVAPRPPSSPAVYHVSVRTLRADLSDRLLAGRPVPGSRAGTRPRRPRTARASRSNELGRIGHAGPSLSNDR